MEIDILEGARGTGKSTVALKMRQTIPEVTLVNPTGFHLDGWQGVNKITDYYSAWIRMLHNFSKYECTFLFDRFYFSEAVFSKLYKNYSFSKAFTHFNAELDYLSEKGVKINIFYLTINDEEELSERLNRDKVPFSEVEESVKETLLQQKEYSKLFEGFANFHSKSNLKLHTIDTSGKTTGEVYNEILKLKTTK